MKMSSTKHLERADKIITLLKEIKCVKIDQNGPKFSQSLNFLER